MTHDHLAAVLEEASAKLDAEGWTRLPEGRSITLYAAHDGVQLTMGRIEAVAVKGSFVRARNMKGEIYLLSVEDIFAASTEGATPAGRKAGFI